MIMNIYFFHKQNDMFKMSTRVLKSITKYPRAFSEMILIFSSLIQGLLFDSNPRNATALKLQRERICPPYGHIRLKGLVSTVTLRE